LLNVFKDACDSVVISMFQDNSFTYNALFCFIISLAMINCSISMCSLIKSNTSSNEGFPNVNAKSIFFTPSGTGRPQSAIIILSVCIQSLNTLDMSLVCITVLYIQSPLSLYNILCNGLHNCS